MSMTLFVGDNQEYLADLAKQHDPRATLISYHNWQDVLNTATSGTYYTSLSDLPKIDQEISVCWELMQRAQVICYAEPDTWSDHTAQFAWTNQKTMLEYYLWLQLRSGKTVQGLNLDHCSRSSYLDTKAQRNCDQPVLWVAGCSITHGIGVEPDQRYGHLVGQQLSMPTRHLTQPGSSVEWAADQILRSDIRPEDTVIWGITQELRAPQATNGQIDSWGDDSEFDVEYLMHETRFYKALTSVYQVINFCGKVGCRLLLLPLICSEKLIMNLINQPSFVPLPYQVQFCDLGSDNVHPGPRQHKIWADVCADLIKS